MVTVLHSMRYLPIISPGSPKVRESQPPLHIRAVSVAEKNGRRRAHSQASALRDLALTGGYRPTAGSQPLAQYLRFSAIDVAAMWIPSWLSRKVDDFQDTGPIGGTGLRLKSPPVVARTSLSSKVRESHQALARCVPMPCGITLAT